MNILLIVGMTGNRNKIRQLSNKSHRFVMTVNYPLNSLNKITPSKSFKLNYVHIKNKKKTCIRCI